MGFEPWAAAGAKQHPSGLVLLPIFQEISSAVPWLFTELSSTMLSSRCCLRCAPFNCWAADKLWPMSMCKQKTHTCALPSAPISLPTQSIGGHLLREQIYKKKEGEGRGGWNKLDHTFISHTYLSPFLKFFNFSNVLKISKISKLSIISDFSVFKVKKNSPSFHIFWIFRIYQIL